MENNLSNSILPATNINTGNKNIINILLIIAIIILLLCIFSYVSEKFTNTDNNVIVPKVKFPFKNLFDDENNLVNVILISAPLYSDDDMANYQLYKNMGMYISGISSYQEFPDRMINPHEHGTDDEKTRDYANIASSWLPCHRDLPPILKNSKLPMQLITEADLKNTDHYKPDPKIEKIYDFIYICLDDNDTCTPGWNWHIRNWDLAKKCIEIMCSEYNLKGAIIGRTNCEFTSKCLNNVTRKPMLPFHEFQIELQKAKFIFAPNTTDASPRVITESLCYNMPALVNYNITGGWHNIIPGITGEFFTSEHDLRPALEKIINNKYDPREWYLKNRGLTVSGAELAQFYKDIYPNLNNKTMKYCYITI
jgi:hypothetical protein